MAKENPVGAQGNGEKRPLFWSSSMRIGDIPAPPVRLIDPVVEREQRRALLLKGEVEKRVFDNARFNLRHDSLAVRTFDNYKSKVALAERVEIASDALTDDDVYAREIALDIYMCAALIDLHQASDTMQQVFSQRGQSALGYLTINNFDLAGGLDVRVGTVSFLDFYSQDRRSRVPTPSLLRFFLEVRRINEGELPEGFYRDNDTELGREFPQIQRRNLGKTLAYSANTLNGACFPNEANLTGAHDQFSETAPTVKKLLGQMEDFNARVRAVVTHPEHAEFVGIKEVISRFMNASPRLRNYMVHLMTFTQEPFFKEIYRTASASSDDQENGDFYQQLAHIFAEYTEVASSFTRFYTKDDLEEIFEGNREDEDVRPVPTTEAFRRQIAGIIPNKPKTIDDYYANSDDIESIEWGGMVPPQSAKIFFTPNKPMVFSLIFGYNNATGEEINIRITVDAKKGLFDWNFIEAPESPEMIDFSDATKIASGQFLGRLSESLAAKKAAGRTRKQEDENNRVEGGAATVVWPEEKFKGSPAHRRVKRTDGGESPMIAIAEAEATASGAKREIVLPENDILEGLMGSLDHQDRDIVRAEITAFNETGAGVFKMLSSDPRYGRRFVLKINAVSGGIRVLLSEGGKKGDLSTYTVVDIRSRGDIYKKNKPWGK